MILGHNFERFTLDISLFHPTYYVLSTPLDLPTPIGTILIKEYTRNGKILGNPNTLECTLNINPIIYFRKS